MSVNLKRKGGPSSFPQAMEVVIVMVGLVLLINTNSCGASFVLKSNVSSYRQCISSGAMEGCLIADDLDLDLDFDFYMDTHVVRILADENPQTPPVTEIANSKVRIPCYKEPGKEYNCDPKPRTSEQVSGGRNTYQKL